MGKAPAGRPRTTLSEGAMRTMRAYVRRGMKQYGGLTLTQVTAEPSFVDVASPVDSELQRFIEVASSAKGADVSVIAGVDAGRWQAQRVRLLRHFFERPMTTANVRLVFAMLLQCDGARAWRAAHRGKRDRWLDEFDRRLLALAEYDVLGSDSKTKATPAAYVHSDSVGALARFVVDVLCEEKLIAGSNATKARQMITKALAEERSRMAHALAFESQLVDARKAEPDTVGLARANFSLGPTTNKETTKKHG